MKILVPTSIALDLDLDLDPGDEAVDYDPAVPVPAEHADAEVMVVWGNSAANLADAARRLPRLRLVQSLHAGPDAVLAAGFNPEVQLASGRSLHDGPVILTPHAAGNRPQNAGALVSHNLMRLRSGKDAVNRVR